MLEKPELDEGRLVACLYQEYGLPVAQVGFLPLGADLNTAVYRVDTAGDQAYFCRLRSGAFDATSVELPFFLSESIQQVLAPYRTLTGMLWTHLDAFAVILYPFIEGRNGREIALSEQQWREFGHVLKQLHTTTVPDRLWGRIREETYCPRWHNTVRTFLKRVDVERYDDPVARGLAAFIRDKRDQIADLVDCAEQLAQVLLSQPRERVLCHSDVHGSNILVGEDGALTIIDWDDPIRAPKERDLMYVGGAQGFVGYSPQEEETLFYRGYGRTLVDPFGLAYYRYERIVEDLGVYCEQLLLSDEGGPDREQSLIYFKSNWDPDGTIEVAYGSDKTSMQVARGGAKGLSVKEACCESYTIRYVASIEELEQAYDLLGAQFTPPTTHADRLFEDLRRCYPQDRCLMLVVEKEGRIVGGAMGFENVLRIIALEPGARGKGLGRRLVQTYEVGAMQRGVEVISLGAIEDAKGFYQRVGYHGKSRMQKELPLPGRVLEWRLKKLEALVGDLESGQVVRTDELGKVPSLF